jgi:hypothetical protein
MNVAARKLKTQKNSSNTRIFLLMLGITLFIGLIVFRLFYLQIVNHGYYEQLATNQHDLEQTILPKRGDIYATSYLNGQRCAQRDCQRKEHGGQIGSGFGHGSGGRARPH